MEFITPVHLHDLELPKSDRFCVSDAEPASVVEDEELMLANLHGERQTLAWPLFNITCCIIQKPEVSWCQTLCQYPAMLYSISCFLS